MQLQSHTPGKIRQSKDAAALGKYYWNELTAENEMPGGFAESTSAQLILLLSRGKKLLPGD
jgi:hypothetical protein